MARAHALCRLPHHCSTTGCVAWCLSHSCVLPDPAAQLHRHCKTKPLLPVTECDGNPAGWRTLPTDAGLKHWPSAQSGASHTR